jgi:aminoglycoside 6'-N-acetyltransferase I
MGYTISWVALKGGDRKTSCSVFGLRQFGVAEHIHTSDIGGIQMPEGWYLTYFKHKDIEDSFLEKLSYSGEVVHCFVEEHLMISASSAWKSGRRLWRAAYHAGNDGTHHLEASGDLPAAFERIRATQLAKQNATENQGRPEEDHVFDVPMELGKELTGFDLYQFSSRMRVDVFRASEELWWFHSYTAIETHVRLAEPKDCNVLARLREALWPESAAEEHARELALILAGKRIGTLPLVVFVAETDAGTLIGFLEVGLRSHAESCDPRQPVGYVEGWYVAENHRGRGIGKKLLAAAEDWARSQGCVEMASDTQMDNTLSQSVHERLGFRVVERSVNYRKKL